MVRHRHTDQTANEAEQSAESLTRGIKPANLPKWEEVYPVAR